MFLLVYWEYFVLVFVKFIFFFFGCFRFRMSSILDDFDVIGIIGLGYWYMLKKKCFG